MALASRMDDEERSTILRAMARSWVTLATQMDRLTASEKLQSNKIRKSQAK
jgi:hypothetical protein